MNNSQADKRLWDIEYSSAMNQLYYERLSARWGLVERIAVGATVILAACSFGLGVASAVKPDLGGLNWWGFVVSAVSLTVGIGLLIIPVHQTKSHQEDMRRRWTHLLSDCQRLAIRLARLNPDEAADDTTVYELERLIEVENDIESDEWPCDEKLILSCQRELNRRTYPGVKVGTYEEVEARLANSPA